jgi:phage gp46-like protein
MLLGLNNPTIRDRIISPQGRFKNRFYGSGGFLTKDSITGYGRYGMYAAVQPITPYAIPTDIYATIAGTSTVAGLLTGLGALAVTIPGTSTVTAALTYGVGREVLISGSSTATATLTSMNVFRAPELTGLDLKLFNVDESVPGLIDLVGYFDIGINAYGDFELEQGMTTNLIVSLFADRRAEPYEVTVPMMRRGWWGNVNADEPGFEIGSKLWLLDQSRLTTNTILMAQQFAQQSLEWMVKDDLTASVAVEALPSNRAGHTGIELNVTLVTKVNKTEYKWYTVWNATK